VTALDKRTGTKQPATAARSGGRRKGVGVSQSVETALGWRTGSNHIVSMALRGVLSLVALLLFAGPLIVLFSGAFDKNPDPTKLSLVPNSPTLSNFTLAGERGVWHYLGNSLVIAGGGLLLQVSVSVFAAYALARKRFRGRAIISMLFLITMMLPEEVIAIPLSLIIGDIPVLHISLKGTLVGMILPLGAWGFSIFVMTEFMRELPIELEEAARIDGAGEMRIFAQIILPLCRPALGVITVFGFIMIWDQYLLPLIVANDPSDYPLSVALSTLRSDTTGPGLVLAGALLALVPSLVVYLLLQKSLISGMTAGALKG
jgi:multiple sugar transport system permease protein